MWCAAANDGGARTVQLDAATGFWSPPCRQHEGAFVRSWHAFKLAGGFMKILVDYARGYGDERRACTALMEQKPWLLPRLTEALGPADGTEPAPKPSEALASLLIRPIQRLTRAICRAPPGVAMSSPSALAEVNLG